MSGYLADYNAGKANADAYKSAMAQLPPAPTPHLPPQPAATSLAQLIAPPSPDTAYIAAVAAYQRQLQARGIGRNLSASGTWSSDWVEALAEYGHVDEKQTQRSTDEDVRLLDAVVDQNPTCFSPAVRAQVRVNEGS